MVDTKNDTDTAVDRAATRTQRTILILGSLIGMIVAILTNLPKLFY